MASEKKQSQIEDLMHSLEQNSNFALISFEKTTHTALEGLRKNLKKNQAHIKVIKNTLFQKAINKLAEKNESYQTLKKDAFPLRNNSAMLSLGQDWSEGLKAFYEFTKKEASVGFKIGLLDNKAYPKEELIKIAKLPGKHVLMAKLIGTMKNPMSKTAYALKFNTQKLVYVLNVRAKQTA